MRININVPDCSQTAPSSSRVDLTNTPLPLTRLAPSNELVMIELQGSLEIDDPHADGGQALADIEFHPGREDKPTLLISHHRLEGKLVTLAKPFAVLERKKRSQCRVMRNVDLNQETTEKRSESFSSPVALSHSDVVEPNDECLSPSLDRKRARMAEDQASHTNAFNASSSPIPPRMMPGSEADFSSPVNAHKRARTAVDARSSAFDQGSETSHSDLSEKETATYMDVVCIIRKKLLFSKRPEPVVRLDGAGGEKAKQALGLEV